MRVCGRFNKAAHSHGAPTCGNSRYENDLPAHSIAARSAASVRERLAHCAGCGAVVMSERPARPCKDCRAEGLPLTRPAPHPGPRCVTHHRARKRSVAAAAHAAGVAARFALPPGLYAALCAVQGHGCYLCRRQGFGCGTAGCGSRRKGSRRLAVDHDHSCCPGKTSCGRCVRGLLCGPCNDHMGYLRDNPEAWIRGGLYLANPPAQQVISGIQHPPLSPTEEL